MPRATFKPLSLGSLPRVMVAILAMCEDDREMIANAMNEPGIGKLLRDRFANARTMEFPTRNMDLAEVFDVVLQQPKEWRVQFVEAFDKMLDQLQQEDGFGTEGQIDPRGSHRDL